MSGRLLVIVVESMIWTEARAMGSWEILQEFLRYV